MSRRKSDADQEFGSDSFLDIIANIVGILIILIVVAGVKVARQADSRDPVAVQLSQNLQQVADSRPDRLPEQPQSRPTEFPWQQGESAVENFKERAPLVSDERLDSTRQELKSIQNEDDLFRSQVQKLVLELQVHQHELDEAAQQLATAKKNLQTSQEEDESATTQVASLKTDFNRSSVSLLQLKKALDESEQQEKMYQGTLDTLDQRQAYVHDALQQVSLETRRLKEILQSNQETSADVDLLQHRLSPVTRQVTREEIHFRLSEGRIAHVPLEQLLEELKRQVSRNRSMVTRFQKYNGTAGPIHGFQMNYIVQRQSLPPMKALEFGQSPVQLSISRWQILPTDGLEAETVDEALKLGSRYRQILEQTPPETAITIWLYPDDFAHFHRLRQFAHQLDLKVAARPLPEGFPITASPSGSRSTSQ